MKSYEEMTEEYQEKMEREAIHVNILRAMEYDVEALRFDGEDAEIVHQTFAGSGNKFKMYQINGKVQEFHLFLNKENENFALVAFLGEEAYFLNRSKRKAFWIGGWDALDHMNAAICQSEAERFCIWDDYPCSCNIYRHIDADYSREDMEVIAEAARRGLSTDEMMVVASAIRVPEKAFWNMVMSDVLDAITAGVDIKTAKEIANSDSYEEAEERTNKAIKALCPAPHHRFSAEEVYGITATPMEHPTIVLDN